MSTNGRTVKTKHSRTCLGAIVVPSRNLKPCAQHGCCSLVVDGYCERHTQSSSRPSDLRRGSAHARGYGRDWEKIRDLVRREEPFCRYCLEEGRVTATEHIDHIVPKAQGGTDERSNLQGLCQPHHSEKTDRENPGWRTRGLE